MKFTFKGYIKIVAEKVMIRDKECVYMSVEDTGVGIQKKNLKKLFKMFSRIDKTQGVNKSGIGLGLMISYKYSPISHNLWWKGYSSHLGTRCGIGVLLLPGRQSI